MTIRTVKRALEEIERGLTSDLKELYPFPGGEFCINNNYDTGLPVAKY